MQKKDYIPRRDSELQAFLGQFMKDLRKRYGEKQFEDEMIEFAIDHNSVIELFTY